MTRVDAAKLHRLGSDSPAASADLFPKDDTTCSMDEFNSDVVSDKIFISDVLRVAWTSIDFMHPLTAFVISFKVFARYSIVRAIFFVYAPSVVESSSNFVAKS